MGEENPSVSVTRQDHPHLPSALDVFYRDALGAASRQVTSDWVAN